MQEFNTCCGTNVGINGTSPSFWLSAITTWGCQDLRPQAGIGTPSLLTSYVAVVSRGHGGPNPLDEDKNTLWIRWYSIYLSILVHKCEYGGPSLSTLPRLLLKHDVLELFELVEAVDAERVRQPKHDSNENYGNTNIIEVEKTKCKMVHLHKSYRRQDVPRPTEGPEVNAQISKITLNLKVVPTYLCWNNFLRIN